LHALYAPLVLTPHLLAPLTALLAPLDFTHFRVLSTAALVILVLLVQLLTALARALLALIAPMVNMLLEELPPATSARWGLKELVLQ
jgi:hypothetical protein